MTRANPKEDERRLFIAMALACSPETMGPRASALRAVAIADEVMKILEAEEGDG